MTENSDHGQPGVSGLLSLLSTFDENEIKDIVYTEPLVWKYCNVKDMPSYIIIYLYIYLGCVRYAGVILEIFHPTAQIHTYDTNFHGH